MLYSLFWEQCELIFGLGNVVCQEYTRWNNSTLQQALKLCVGTRGEEDTGVREQDRDPGSTTQRDLSLNFSTCLPVATCSPCALGMLSSLFSLVIPPFTFYFWEKAEGQVWPLHRFHSTSTVGPASPIFCSVRVISTREAMEEMSHVGDSSNQYLESRAWRIVLE